MKPKLKRKKLRRKPRVLSIEQRREMLRGVTWGQFYASDTPDCEVLRIDNLRFKAGFGLFLGQPAVAVANGKEFIIIQYLKDPEEILKNYRSYDNSPPDVLIVTEPSTTLGELLRTAIDAYPYPEFEDKYVVGPKLKTNEELNDA